MTRTLSFAAGINTNYYDNGSGLGETFRRQLNNNMQKSLCFTISIPLFDRFSTRNQVRTARIDEDNARLSLENEKKQLYKNIERRLMRMRYRATRESTDSTTKSRSAANQEAHRHAMEESMQPGNQQHTRYNGSEWGLANAALSGSHRAKYTCPAEKTVCLLSTTCSSLTD
ncbi:MAG: TolC family protein [Phocaeicola sp.]